MSEVSEVSEVDEFIERFVQSAPPLSQEARDYLSTLLRPEPEKAGEPK